MDVNAFRMHLALTACLALGSGLARGDEAVPEFVPAAFPEDDRALARKLRFPDVEGDVSVTIKCDTRVDASGRIEQTFCFPGGVELIAYQRAVFGAVQKSRMVPAQLRGERVSVWIQFSVIFKRSGESESMRVFPNQLLDVKEYGLDYTSPQRYDPMLYEFSCQLVQGIWVAISVDERGVPVASRTLDGKEGACTKAILKAADAGRYIPAFNKGRPVRTESHVMFFNEAIVR